MLHNNFHKFINTDKIYKNARNEAIRDKTIVPMIK